MLRVSWIVVLIAVSSCSRSKDGLWVVKEEDPPLLEDLELTPPEGTLWSPTEPILADKRFRLRTEWTTRQRGPGVPASHLSLLSKVHVERRLRGNKGSETTWLWQFSLPEVEVDPPVDKIEEETVQALDGLRLRLSSDASGRISEVALSQPQSSTPAPQGQDIVSALRRLLPVLPGRRVQVGDTWDFRLTLSGNKDVTRRLSGRYRFLGLTRTGAAAIDLDYDIEVMGGRKEIKATGSGVGRGVFLLDEKTGDLIQAQVVEWERTLVTFASRRKGGKIEQVARTFLEIEVLP